TTSPLVQRWTSGGKPGFRSRPRSGILDRGAVQSTTRPDPASTSKEVNHAHGAGGHSGVPAISEGDVGRLHGPLSGQLPRAQRQFHLQLSEFNCVEFVQELIWASSQEAEQVKGGLGMSHRFLASISVLAVVLLAPAPVAGQAPKPQAKNAAATGSRTAPRTPWGKPDLRGIWDFATITPIERPSDLAGKEVLSEEEAAQQEEQAAQRRVDRPPKPGDTGSYNQFWFDSGTKVIGTKRTSLIVDPPDGKIPPLTP